MSPNVEKGESLERLRGDYQLVPTHNSRILPEQPQPAQAWTETETDSNSPGESRRLLDSAKPTKHAKHAKPPKSLQAGIALGVGIPHKKPNKTGPEFNQKNGKLPVKTKFQKRKEKLFALMRPPYFILSVITVMVTVHAFGGEDLLARLEWLPKPWWREPWRLFTYGIVHAGTKHLALNALVALAVGWPLEREQGWWRLALAWGGGVAAGALGAGVLQPYNRVVGASGAVFALLTAHIPNVCLRFGHIPLWWFRPLSVLVLGSSELCWEIVQSPSTLAAGATVLATGVKQAPVEDDVAWSAHVLGAAFGIPLGFILFTGENSSKRYIFVSRVMSVLALMSLTTLVVVHYTYWYNGKH